MRRTVAAILLAVGTIYGCTGKKPVDPPRVEWKVPLSVSGDHMVQLGDGNFAICGSRKKGPETFVPALAVVDAGGNEVWSREYEGLPVRAFVWLDKTTDEGFITVGSTARWASNESDIGVVRLNERGDILWTKTLGGPSCDFGASVLTTREGDFVVCGATVSFGAGKLDAYLLRLSPTGDLLWQRTFGAETWEGQYESGCRAIQLRDGGFLVVGSSDSRSLVPQGASVAVYLVRTDSSGEKLWERTFGIPGGFDVGYSALELDTGDILIGGTRGNAVNGLQVIRIDSRGNVLLRSDIPASDAIGSLALATATDGGCIVGNRDWRRGGNGSDAYVACLDREGVLRWDLRLGETGYHRVEAIEAVQSGGYVLLCSGPDWAPYLVKLAADTFVARRD